MEATTIISKLQYKSKSFENIAFKTEVRKSGEFYGILGVARMDENDTLLIGDLVARCTYKEGFGEVDLKVNDTSGAVAGNMFTKLHIIHNKLRFAFKQSDIFFRNVLFNIDTTGVVEWQHSRITLTDIHIFNNREDVSIAGFYDFKSTHDVHVNINKLDLDLVNLFYQRLGFKVDGMAQGTMHLKGGVGAETLESALSIDHLALDEDTLGDFSIKSNYNEQQKRIILYAKSLSGKLKKMEASGYMDVSSNPYGLNFDVVLEESDLRSFQAFLKEHATIYAGTILARCSFTGKLDDVKIDGTIDLAKVNLRVEYLKSIFAFNTSVRFNKSEIAILPTILSDPKGNTAGVTGIIQHKSFSNFYYDIRMGNLKKVQVLNTSAKDNDLYYGKAFVSGNLTLKGPQSQLMLEGDVKTEKGTEFFIPLKDSEAEESALINYVNKDTFLVIKNKSKEADFFGFSMNTVLNITKDVDIQIIFDEQKGDKISGSGEGIIKMELTSQGAFNMYGEVRIDNGEYKFTALDVFTKKFNLKKGSSITWAGDPMQARLNITGSYNVRRTSVANILTTVSEADREAAKQQRVPVECLMYIRGNLQNPEYKFDLAFNENQGVLSTKNQTALESSLNSLRAEPQQMEQQVINLILFGNFTPLTGAQFEGNSNFNSGINNTLSDIASAQANNIISQVIPGFDVNMDVQSRDQQRFQSVLLSASKRLFNDRLEVQGSFNIDRDNPNNNLMTQYNLTRDGNLKARAYTRNTTNPLYPKPINTQGVGLYYRKEFDKFIELFKKRNKDIYN